MKKETWEERLDKLMCPHYHGGDECCWEDYNGELIKDIKDFISSLLKSQREELVEKEIQGLKKLQKNIKGGIYGHDGCGCQRCDKAMEFFRWLDKCFEDYQSLIKEDTI